MSVPVTRAKVLSLFRSLLRSSRDMPTPERRQFVEQKSRMEFSRNKNLTNEEEIELEYRVGEVHLDTVKIQAAHLTSLFNKDFMEEVKKQMYRPAIADDPFSLEPTSSLLPTAEQIQNSPSSSETNQTLEAKECCSAPSEKETQAGCCSSPNSCKAE